MAYHNSFILVDRQGAKVLETMEREWVVIPVNETRQHIETCWRDALAFEFRWLL